MQPTTNNDTLTYQLTHAPGGVLIDTATGVISWIPASDQTGFNNIEVTVDDGRVEPIHNPS